MQSNSPDAVSEGVSEADTADGLIPRPKTAADVLDLIDQFLIDHRNNYFIGSGYHRAEAAKLWDVLTALRGPDSCREKLKECATIPIRRAAFPKFIEAMRAGDCFHDIPARFGYGDYDIKFDPFVCVDLDYMDSQHFPDHVRRAGEALGIMPK